MQSTSTCAPIDHSQNFYTLYSLLQAVGALLTFMLKSLELNSPPTAS